MEYLCNIILNWFFKPSADQKKEVYLKHNQYPHKDKIFIDNRGNVSVILGKETLINTCQALKDFKLGEYNI